jgi:hypothetical protein
MLRNSRQTILEMKVNSQVDDSLFVFRPPPGAMLLTPQGAIQQEPGGLDLLDDMVGWLRRYYPAPEKQRGSWVPYLGLPLAALIIVLGEVRRRRVLRARRGAKPAGMEYEHVST